MPYIDWIIDSYKLSGQILNHRLRSISFFQRRITFVGSDPEMGGIVVIFIVL